MQKKLKKIIRIIKKPFSSGKRTLKTLFPLCNLFIHFKEEMNLYGVTQYRKFPLFCDYLHCYIHYRTNKKEFFLLKLYIYKNSYRKDFLMRNFNHSKIWQVNKKYDITLKWKMYKRLMPFYKRECLFVDGTDEQKFINFVQKHRKVITKPNDGSLGNGISVFTNSEADARIAKKVFLSSTIKKIVCEEYISQHPTLLEICPDSVNTLRFLSFYDGKDVKFLSVVLRCGRTGSVVDNICAGGLGVDVDIDTGVLITPGRDYDNNTYIRHPDTNVILPGIQLPFWQETLEFVKQVHLNFTECSLLGIDIAFTPDGPCLVELNNAPGPMINQLVNQKPCGREIHEFVKTHRLYDKHNKRIG